MLNTSISTHHANDKQEEDEEKYEAWDDAGRDLCRNPAICRRFSLRLQF
jgi:hypothetical protein